MAYITELCDHLNPKGYLVYTSGFKKMYPGHFSKYAYQLEADHSPAQISRIIKKWLKERFDLVYTGFNGKPSIFKLK
jgi:hypothetical protein